ncbi:MAG: aminoglycoside 3'-phosphotransferase [Clostridia bacterium]|nr:aminoglycoside 3'-phosphotransferase [Clostridia bacterium]
MERKPISIIIDEIPEIFHPYLSGADIYDSSCSPEARVYYIDKDNGYFLKKAPKWSMEKEAAMAEFFHSKGLSANVIRYISLKEDWFLSERVMGEDGTAKMYLDDPERLCDAFALALRTLHETSGEGCPIPNRTADYIALAEHGYKKGLFDTSIFPGMEFKNADASWRFFSENAKYLKNDTLIHGDYCLPNIIFDDWRFSGFIDLGNGGMGDRHIDLFWGAWTLFFNLKTSKYTERFFDAYGRDKVDPDILKIIPFAEVFG